MVCAACDEWLAPWGWPRTVPSATADGWWRTVVMASGPMEPASSGAIDLIAAAHDSAAMALPPSLAPSLALGGALRGHGGHGTHARRRDGRGIDGSLAFFCV